jgi:nucleotide-binding universal stress UspA family protein
MGKILCPTRGGAASHRTQDAAIGLAKEQGKPLVFLFVVDTHFLDRTERAVRPDIVVEEIARMGRFLLTMAQERAAAAGVQAEVRIRRGELREELINAVREEGADLVILGRPTGEESAFRSTDLEALVATIERETGAKARIV